MRFFTQLALALALSTPASASDVDTTLSLPLSVANGGTAAATAAAARTSLGAAASGANSDITSLLGTTLVGVGTATPAYTLDIKGAAGEALTGTVTVAAGTASVTGAGTSFLSQLVVGSAIRIGAQTLQVLSIASNTALTLTTNHTAGASGATAYTDDDPIRATTAAGNELFSVDRFGSVRVSGGLDVAGTFAQSRLSVAVGDSAFSTALTGTTSCSDVACTGTGTSYTTELGAGSAIFDLANNRYFFVRSVTNNTELTLVTPADFGTDLDNATVYRSETTPALIQTPLFTDGYSYTDNNDFFMDATGRVTIENFFGVGPTLTVTMGGIGDGPALAVNGKARLGQLGTAFTAMGACTVASNTLSTTATNLTCTGVPASAAVAVQCSGSAAFSTPTAGGLYCRATGTANQIACNTSIVNVTAMTFNCSWVQP